ncbi:PREDICTED: arf-GAP with Rho-GAP domain, ANK repeat and PH domain-containing protein 1 isoform X1 [Lepidothrix coronata]|uniref:Arf-GAP with Rho-GAP domain, ANK repeat and PH domain-containing protein 1 isoform X1 n=1 Tax=Lepidothrix coronata TaxID=321398 RepID=A0A6J0IXW3_9PASS|nr:PREDICTED: arf-GAP with Rho-GAP domain, ANK repeat and PH domain-containing protein 1 isoform X1 [Lepidothrix coronata]XP_017691520.1 PREDICTED: arf-GAP with Rho-GAP domain, ANK repeat and PH domain-containing protein 1 isoform X1 [Lepidothrix coronata]XP_017691521.1 PREDICTED: arf-GAP with Rho-GAP domain, ANK repeat and PH domain-containing protein 1 isoform X1 [Lepidothrix coronata]XP_017691522.1 PREDICTED: arf-GAP with Rho-GAP domain, ANK repeat and PH domain-containing protein 1 isoform X
MEEEGSLPVATWLAALHLDQYVESFQQSNLWSVWDCRALTDEGLTRLGVLLPGHRRRILLGLQKAFAEAALPAGTPPAPAGKPVPMKRHIFRLSTATAPEQPELRALPVPGGMPGGTPPLEPERAASFAQLPPPIPPRVGCRPPVKFSPLLSGGSPEPPPVPHSHLPAPEEPSPPALVEKPAAESRARPPLPPLPAKRHQLEAKGQSLKGPPLPDRPPVLPPRAVSQRSTPAKEEVPIPDRTPSVPLSPLSPLPRTKPPVLLPPELPCKASVPFVPEFDDSDYEDSAWEEELARPMGEMAKEDAEPGTGRPRSLRFNSLFSDDELGEDQPEVSPADGSSSWSDRDPSPRPPAPDAFPGGSPGTLSDSMEGTGATAPLSPTIRAGWLDKNPPQGSYIYQKRWVKLDADYLRYFDSEKDTYSKRLIPVSSISRVTSVGDQKFEVITNNRNFVFRAESDAERNEWIRTLQQIAEERKSKAPERTLMSLATDGAPEPADKSGFLELRGFKHKLFVVVAGDKVFLYKNAEDYRLGIGITYIEMNVGNVKEVDRRGFDLTTPYRLFSFSADSEQEKEEWVEAMQQSIAEALSNSEVAERIWAVESNRCCADCGSPKPEWASINLCVVICKRCAGEHRGLGPGITKVRSLKMDRKVWTEELIELFQQFGNAMANEFWAANVPPSEAIGPTSGSQERRRFLIAKYREGKYRHYHPLFGNQEELDRALCVAVTTSDLKETQALLFCGASVTCDTGDSQCPTPLALAERSGQRLQMEFLLHNKTSELPRLEMVGSEEKPYSVPLPSVTHSGFLYKTPSMAKPVSERKGLEEFSRRWCTLQDGVLSYYENDRNAVPNGEIRVEEIVCLVNNPPHAHGIESTFEVYTEAERLYLFGLESSDSAREWLKSIAKSFVHPCAEELLALDFERLGRLHYKGGLTLERTQEGWFALAGSTLHVCSEDGQRQEPLQLRKLQELSIQGEHEVLVLVERRRTLYIQGERKLDFLGWVHAIQKAAGSSGDTLSEQQLTESDVPLLVDRCIDYITQCGLTSEGIYRKSGQNSKTTSLLEVLQRDARRVRLKEGEHHVDDVANTLKRFFRDLGDGLFTRQWAPDWLWATALEDEEAKVSEYRQLLGALPPVNRATLKALINHLFRVQCFSGENQMNTHNLAIVFGPTLFQTDGKDYKAGRVVEDLINHYVKIFNVNDQEMKKQQDEIMAIMKMREASSSGMQQAGDFICTVYLEEKKTETEQHVKIPATMTAEELTFEILDRRKIVMKEKDYWSCFEVNEREEAERPLHYSEKVLPILHCLGTESYLVVKKQMSMENMLIYLASRVGDCKHGMMKFREERNLLGLGLSTGFHDRYFILNHSCLRLYKEVRSLRQRSPPLESSHKPEKEWPVRNLKVYLGVKKKLRPPTCWGFTVFYENEKHEKQQWYLCCDTQADLREWFATFLQVQNGGALWPSERPRTRAARPQQDARLGNISLIPLRGNESEMRNSVAAFATDPLTLLRNV